MFMMLKSLSLDFNKPMTIYKNGELIQPILKFSLPLSPTYAHFNHKND